ncbi:hypothetical protein IWQ61_007855 [Dispira simplex]|nr:hypothetical protein IWQ61_007855 [Dispira simplex]
MYRPNHSGRAQDPTEEDDHQLSLVFRQAALSVTDLYKKAQAQNRRAYRAGYQQCLDEFVAFLSSRLPTESGAVIDQRIPVTWDEVARFVSMRQQELDQSSSVTGAEGVTIGGEDQSAMSSLTSSARTEQIVSDEVRASGQSGPVSMDGSHHYLTSTGNVGDSTMRSTVGHLQPQPSDHIDNHIESTTAPSFAPHGHRFTFHPPSLNETRGLPQDQDITTMDGDIMMGNGGPGLSTTLISSDSLKRRLFTGDSNTLNWSQLLFEPPHKRTRPKRTDE